MIIKTHSFERDGKKFVEIAQNVFNKLMERLEDLEDLHAIRAAKASNEEAFPMRLFNEIQAGENPIRVFRNYRGMPLKELANLSGISEAYLSQIESGARKGTGKTIKAIAKSMNVPVDIIIT